MAKTLSKRYSGVLAHPTSFPSPYGIGDFGKGAYDFINFLTGAGQSLWQILPLGHTGYGDSPYQAFSAFAGQPLLISPDELIKDGLLYGDDLRNYPHFNPDHIYYGDVIPAKLRILHRSYEIFKESADLCMLKEFDVFCEHEKDWLDDYALFMAGKDAHGGACWLEWEDDLRDPDEEIKAAWRERLADSIEYYKYIQFIFFRQWNAIRDYAHVNGIKIVGDIPIYVALDSAEVWVYPDLFELDENLVPKAVAGCPPDAFSPTGQLWGNPLFRWDEMKKDGYSWWTKRIKAMSKLYDIVRIDHFRGFDSYYAIPGTDDTARNGEWREGPGMDLFHALEKKLGKLNIIVEDLGFLTPSVLKLVKDSGFPGMKVVQFAFDSREGSDYLPHNYPTHCVVYTGTHDNDTILGWMNTAPKASVKFAKEYLNLTKEEGYNWGMMRGAWASVGDLAIVPMQDIIGVGSEGRMNTPSTLGGNWEWRATADQIDNKLAKRLYKYMQMYGRVRKDVKEEAKEEA